MSGDADILAGDRQQLRLFVATSRSRLQALLQQLQWTEAGVKAKHRATKEETTDELPPSCCNNPAFSVQVDEATVREILGTDSELATSSQRLQLYEHVLERTAKHPAFEQDNAAFAELVGVTKRDQQKRRRHRKSKPTLNEELRQLVDLQMEALQRQRAAAAVSSGKRKRSRSRSPERQRHRRPEKRERERERERERDRERERERERKRHRKHRSRSRSRSRSHSRSLHRRKHHKQHRSRERY